MPSALAVLRLITNSNLVDCTTGRSAGLSPLRIRPDVKSDLAIGVCNVIAIAHQPALCDEFAVGVHVRDGVTSSLAR